MLATALQSSIMLVFNFNSHIACTETVHIYNLTSNCIQLLHTYKIQAPLFMVFTLFDFHFACNIYVVTTSKNASFTYTVYLNTLFFIRNLPECIASILSVYKPLFFHLHIISSHFLPYLTSTTE